MAETLQQESVALAMLPYTDFDALRAAIIERRAELPKRLEQVARFALDNPDEIALGTVAEIARAAEVQPSTLIRFSQAFGFTGFSDLQQIFQTRLRDRWPDYRERLALIHEKKAERAGAFGLLEGFIEASLTSLMRLRDSIVETELTRAVETLAQAKIIYLLGQRRAFPISSYLAYAFSKLSIHAVLLDNIGSMLDGQAETLDRGDALLAITFTPYTPITCEAAARIARRGIPVVSITDSAFSPLVPVSTVWLQVAEADHSSFRSLAASLSLAMALAVAVADRRMSLNEARQTERRPA